MRSSSARSFLDVADWWKQRFVAPVRKRRPAARQRKLFAESLESRMVLSVAGLDAYIAAEPIPDLATVEWVGETTAATDADAIDQALFSSDPAQIAAGEAACAAGAMDDGGAGDGSGGGALNPEDVVIYDEVLDFGEGEGSGTGTGSPPEISNVIWEREGDYWAISGTVFDDEDMFGQTAYFGAPLNMSVTINAEWNFHLTVEWGDNPPSSIDIYTIDADGNPSGTYTLYFT